MNWGNNMKCYKCNHEVENIFKYTITNRGYGSDFDMAEASFDLCSKCDKPEYEDWCNECPSYINEYCEDYKYEDNLYELINSFPLENQEKIYNNGTFGGYSIPTQDWIDIQNGIELSDEKYKEYGIYSPKEIQAYKERFPTCDEPMNVIYEDGSKVCRCVCGAFGSYGQELGLNIDKNCYKCKWYSLRKKPIQDVTSTVFEQFKIFTEGKENYLRFKDIFEV
jgi:hypothetical protein